MKARTIIANDFRNICSNFCKIKKREIICNFLQREDAKGRANGMNLWANPGTENSSRRQKPSEMDSFREAALEIALIVLLRLWTISAADKEATAKLRLMTPNSRLIKKVINYSLSKIGVMLQQGPIVDILGNNCIKMRLTLKRLVRGHCRYMMPSFVRLTWKENKGRRNFL